MVHLIVPHIPYVVDADCDVVAGRSDPIQQTACAVGMIEELVATLRDLDRYDDSLIVVHGDHGARFGIEDGRLVDPRG